MVKKYTTKLAQKLHLSSGKLAPWLQLFPFLFLMAVLITNTSAWLNGAPWYSSVLNGWLLLGWLAGTGLIYRFRPK
ncbi:hypothetical protein [Adhaeribacter pallidiroseus]|uniref:Uncharacterized protein n=1 Tax=Adhaeribacter pallidiroseus TaxID=2072847 RepID=A0A369QNC8_9BACT|nr:hypothetical protein [Adhaeribacter pallidiroseus]RDC66391.1 hypothetical protein AHMF7616_05022 [Adhaeribacter pallidiroseus]